MTSKSCYQLSQLQAPFCTFTAVYLWVFLSVRQLETAWQLSPLTLRSEDWGIEKLRRRKRWRDQATMSGMTTPSLQVRRQRRKGRLIPSSVLSHRWRHHLARPRSTTAEVLPLKAAVRARLTRAQYLHLQTKVSHTIHVVCILISKSMVPWFGQKYVMCQMYLVRPNILNFLRLTFSQERLIHAQSFFILLINSPWFKFEFSWSSHSKSHKKSLLLSEVVATSPTAKRAFGSWKDTNYVNVMELEIYNQIWIHKFKKMQEKRSWCEKFSMGGDSFLLCQNSWWLSWTHTSRWSHVQ